MRRATVYQRGTAVIVHSSSQTTDGVWILSEPCVRLPTACSDADLGEALQSALEGSKGAVPHPTRWKEILEPLLKAAGVKAWKTFANGAICVEVEQEAENLNIIPTINLGVEEGFQADEQRKISMSMPARPDALGASLREAIACAR